MGLSGFGGFGDEVKIIQHAPESLSSLVQNMQMTSAFAIPYQTMILSYLWFWRIPVGVESYVLIGAMAGYLVYVIIALAHKLGELELKILGEQETILLCWAK
jgi:hypothetical protein